jgi:hypothetical protein
VFERFLRNSLYPIFFLGLLTFVTRLPFRSTILYNWDSVNFALGILDFNVIKHQPHPPGYILYIALGKALNWLAHEPNTALVWLSIGAGVLSVYFTYALGQGLFNTRYAFMSTVLLMTSPLVWFYQEVALTYAVEGFFSVVVAYACYRVLTGSVYWAYVGAVLLGLAGGIRQTTLLILLPLVLYAVFHLSWEHRLKTIIIMVVICLSWGIPLLIMTRGWDTYLTASRQLAGNVGPGRFIDIFNSLFYGGHLALLLVLGFWLGLYQFKSDARPRWERWFITLWVGPGLLVIVFGHLGQAGYILFLLPALFIYTPALLFGALTQIEAPRSDTTVHRQSTIEQKMFLTILAMVVIGTITFLFGGSQFIYKQNRRWQLAQNLPVHYSPAQTIILTDTNRNGDFRHASYYLPNYHVYAFALTALTDPLPVHTIPEVAGWIFHSYQGENNYDLNPDHHQIQAYLDLPPGTTGLLVTHESLKNALIEGNSLPELRITQVDAGLTYVGFSTNISQLVVNNGRLEVH